MRTSRFWSLCMSSGSVINWLVPKFNSTMLVHVPMSVETKESEVNTNWAPQLVTMQLFWFTQGQRSELISVHVQSRQMFGEWEYAVWNFVNLIMLHIDGLKERNLELSDRDWQRLKSRRRLTWTDVNCVGPPNGNDENWFRASVILLRFIKLDSKPS